MTDQDRLAEIKTEWFGPDTQRSPRIRHGLAAHHVDWLVDQAELAKELGDLLPQKINEVERLRGLLKQLEWMATLPVYGDGTEAGCPVCQQPRLPDGHAPTCWLAAALA